MSDNKWIEWKGGECPVPAGTLVDLRYRSKEYEDRIAVPVLTFGTMSDRDFWQHSSFGGDIIAWRLHQPEPAAWNGEGLPPVGTECELFDCEQWIPVIIKFVGEKYVVTERTDLGLGGEVVYRVAERPERFRPIRTEAERKREQAIEAIYKAYQEGPEDVEEAIYNAIAAGKIPGIKLEE